MDADQKTLLINTIAGAMAGVSKDVITRQLQHFYKADAVYGAGVADVLSIQQG